MTEEDLPDEPCKHPEEDRVFHKSDGTVNFLWCNNCNQHFISEVELRPRKRDGSLGVDEEE